MVMIYALTCLVNGKAYIGCTAGNPSKRFREHRCKLNQGTHTEPDLLADWRLHGQSMFSMEIVMQLDDDSLHTKRAMEKFTMQRFKAMGLLYNRNEASFSPTPEAIIKGVANSHLQPGNRWTPEVNEKRRIAQLGKPKNHGHKISATKRAKAMR